MTFQFRDNVDGMSRDQLIAYVGDLESLIAANRETDAKQSLYKLKGAFFLTNKEASLLAVLSDGRTHTKEGLMAAVYGGIADMPELKIIDVFVCKIRRKIAGSGVVIDTVWGTGYVVKDTATLKHVMSGGRIDWTPTEANAPVGRPAGGKNRPFGARRDALIAYLKANAVHGIAAVTSREIAAAAGAGSGSSAIRDFEAKGRVVVLAEPSMRGGKWRLRLTEACQ